MNFSTLRQADIKLLTVFLVLVETRSATLTAERLFLTQSAVSHGLRRLRRLFNDPLFIREPSGMVPTPRAIEVAAELEPLLRGIQNIVGASKGFAAGTAEREFRIGLPNAIGVCLIPKLLDELAAKAPGCSLVVRPTSRTEVSGQLDGDQVHIVMTVMGSTKPWHERIAIGQFGYRCLYDPTLINVGPHMSLAQFTEVPHILTSFKGDRWGVVDTALADRGLKRNVVLAAGDFASIACCLKSTRAIAVLPEYAAMAFANLLDLRTCEVPVELPQINVSMALHHRYANESAIKWFRDLVRTAAAACLQPAPVSTTARRGTSSS